jgi:adenosine deaminase
MRDKILEMPKVELHLHLDGSVSTYLLEKWSGLSREEVIEKVVSKNDVSLKEYLDHFDFVNEFLQTKENLELASYTLGKELEKENVIYAEVRFAPTIHTKKGLTLDEIVDAILLGFSNCNIKVNLILCMIRGATEEDNYKVVELANRYLGKGVVAVDLAGDEEHIPFTDSKYFFNICKTAGIPTTIHAGEVLTRDIPEIIPYTKRIGHGIKISDNLELMDLVKKNDMLLEVCPNSNIDTKNISSYQDHPVKKIYDYGIKVCINTDNRTVSDITLTDEYCNLINNLGFTYDDLMIMNLNAIDGAFITLEDKLILRKLLQNKKGF